LRKVLRRARTIEVLDPRKLSALEKERDGSRDDANDARRRAEDAERRRDAAEAKARALEEEATSLRLRRDEKEADAARWRARAEEAAAAAAAAEEREERRRRAATAPPSTPTAAVAAVAVDADWTPALVGAKSVGRLEAVAEEEVTIGVLCDALPRVALHVLVQRRGELLPLFQRAIARCPEPERRAGLTALLFALIKRPGADQRRVIADACANIASIVGDERTAEELVPCCFLQVDHKHEERRMLVAETCGRLAPVLGVGLRSSLLLTMLQQQAETDAEAAVRLCVVRNLRALLDADPDFSTCRWTSRTRSPRLRSRRSRPRRSRGCCVWTATRAERG
jgi:hypothetical protein